MLNDDLIIQHPAFVAFKNFLREQIDLYYDFASDYCEVCCLFYRDCHVRVEGSTPCLLFLVKMYSGGD